MNERAIHYAMVMVIVMQAYTLSYLDFWFIFNKITFEWKKFHFLFSSLAYCFWRVSIIHTYICVHIVYLVNSIWNRLAHSAQRFYFNCYDLSVQFMAFLEFFQSSVFDIEACLKMEIAIQAFSYGSVQI